jgi:GH18 family chitinase
MKIFNIKIMKKPWLILFVLFFFCFSFLNFSATAQNCKEIIGYYPSWQWYNRAQLMGPDNLDYTRYTILNYAFFAPDDDGNLWGTDAWADSCLLRGAYDWSSPVQPAYIPNTSLIDIAHAWGVKVIPSIGGWTLSDKFPAIAADSVKRHRFASQCAHLIRDFKFDGIDIDWEYPGYIEHKGTRDDKVNFTLLMQAIRDSIDAVGKTINTKMILSAALGCGDTTMLNIEYDKIKNILDYLNMMTYDFNGTWSEETNHNSPLYVPAKGAPGSYTRTLAKLTEFGVPPEKINMGVAFYGRTFKSVQSCVAGYAPGQAPLSTPTNVSIGNSQLMNMVFDVLTPFTLDSVTLMYNKISSGVGVCAGDTTRTNNLFKIQIRNSSGNILQTISPTVACGSGVDTLKIAIDYTFPVGNGYKIEIIPGGGGAAAAHSHIYFQNGANYGTVPECGWINFVGSTSPDADDWPPFYNWKLSVPAKAELFAKHSGKVDNITFARDEGMPQYFNIMLAMDQFDDHWDDTSKVPYLTGKEINTFVTYDNEKSMRLKAEYVRDNNLAGVIIWDCTGDYIERKPGMGLIKSTPLCDVLVDVLKPCARKRIKKRWY